jgi:hypothetical protein
MSEEAQVAEAPVDAGQAPSAQPVSDWRSEIPEEIRSHKSLETIQDVGSLAKSFVNAQSMIGADKVAKPGKHATADDWNNFYDKVGRPASADAYELKSKLPEGQSENPEMVNWFKQTAHKVGLLPHQAQSLLDEYNEFSGSQTTQSAHATEEQINQVALDLKKEYGQAFDDRMAVGKGVLENFSAIPVEEFEDLTLSNGMKLGDHPAIIKTMVNIGQYMKEKMGEDTLAGVKTSGGLTPNQASEKLAELTAHDSPYWDAKHPQHSFFVDEAMRYREMVNG